MPCSFAFKGASSEINFCQISPFSGTRSAACIVCIYVQQLVITPQSTSTTITNLSAAAAPNSTLLRALKKPRRRHPRNTYTQDGHLVALTLERILELRNTPHLTLEGVFNLLSEPQSTTIPHLFLPLPPLPVSSPLPSLLEPLLYFSLFFLL